MKPSRTLLGALGLCLMLGAPAAGSEIDQGPSTKPQTKGPVALDRGECSNQQVRSDSDNSVLGLAEICVYLYSFDSLSEIDVLRDYGAVWLQTRFVPTEGWCATDIGTRLELDGGQIEGTTKAPRETGKVTTKLKLTAGGNALEDGSISQRWAAAPGDITTKSLDGHGASTVWSGETSKPVNLVSGLGYSYEMLGSGPENIGFGFTKFSLVTC
jgi:hypothetical protein